MRDFCFVHAADLHLDTPFSGLARTAPALRELLRDASLQAFDNLVQLTIESRAAFLLLAGDIYDGAERGLRAQLRFLEGMERLREAGIRVLLVHGNHDPLSGWSAVRDWPENVTIFQAHEVQSVPIIQGGVCLATIYGISYAQPEMRENLALKFARRAAQGLAIGLLHADASAAKGQEMYSPCTAADLEQAGFDYWALGHLHLRQVVKEGSPWIVYPGNLQGRSFKPSEHGAKGAFLVHVSSGQVQNLDFKPCDVVRFHLLRVDISAKRDLADVRSDFLEQLESLRHQGGSRALLIRGVIEGCGALHSDLRRAEVLEELQQSLQEYAQGEKPFICWESVAAETRGALDLEAIAQRGDFSAELLHVAQKYQHDRQELRQLIERAEADAVKARVFRWLDRSARTDAECEVLLEEALLLALELNEQEGQ
ncbi:MAG TPA: DNA repair exonuclease [Oligoflexia bacterium]|nr:DNA repair exonuclease [Oligoflexia bacterium]